jgi:hypothetical protein
MKPQTKAERRVQIEEWAEEDYQILLKWMAENRAPEKMKRLVSEMLLLSLAAERLRRRAPHPALSQPKAAGRGRRQRF